MKKIIVMFLSLILVFSFFGCSSEDTGSEGQEKAAVSDVGALGDYEIAIKDFALAKDYEGNDAIVVSYDFTNNGEETISFTGAVMETVFQNGVELDYTPVYENEEDYTAVDDVTLTEIQPGTTIEVRTSHKLSDLTSPVEVQIEEFLGLGDNKLKKTFEIAQ